MIKSAKSESGAVLLEFVLCFPILMVLFLFAVQFSYIMIAWQVVHYSAYMGARSAMTENVQEKYCGSSLSTAAQFLRQVSGFDPHADPHGETSGWKQWK